MERAFHPSCAFPETGRVELHDAPDGALLFVFRLLSPNVSDACMEQLVFSNVRRFLRYVRRTSRPYHFYFDTRACDVVPLAPLVDFQCYLRDRACGVDDTLRSTTVAVRNRAVEAVLQTALRVSPPRRPLRVVRADPDDDVAVLPAA